MALSNFKDDRHAFYAGWTLGNLRNSGLNVLPVVDEDGDYTDEYWYREGDVTVTVRIPPPPDDWELV